MEKSVRAFLLGAVIVLCASVNALAQASPAPRPSSTPAAFEYGGFVRGYYFTRSNMSNNPAKPYNYINQASENNAVSLHAQANVGAWQIGGTYLYADPFNDCAAPASHIVAGPCKTKAAPASQSTYDDTLPAFRLSTLYEAYVQYKDPAFAAWVGQRVINTPWANASDSRLKPVAFRGADASFALNKQWTLEVADYVSWEDRAQSGFVRSTLITQNRSFADSSGQATTGIPTGGWVDNSGFLFGRLGYAAAPWTVNAYVYAFNDIANALWFDAKYSWRTYAKPYVALQAGTERSTGSSLAGTIDSQIVGLQFGVTPFRNVDFTLGFDDVPQKSQSITLPAGVKCGANHVVSGTTPTSPLRYFLPTGGTPNCTSPMLNVAGAPATIYYGGWASPYTDSYATDVLFTTMISQGMVDRRSAGSAVKIAGTVNLDNKRIRIIAAHAWFQYGNGATGYAPTQETNVDGTYFFSRVPATGPYHGFSIRHRYAERTTFPAFGGLPDFKYNRTQMEYDF